MKFLKRHARAFVAALGLFTAVPVRNGRREAESAGLLLPYMPITGIFIGAIWFGASYVLAYIGLNYYVMAAVMTVLPIVITRGAPVMGFLACSDGITLPDDKKKRVLVMRSRVRGSRAIAAAMCVGILFFAGWMGALTEMDNPYLLLFIPIVSRAASAFAISGLVAVPESSFAASCREGTRDVHRVIIAAEFAAAVIGAFLLSGFPGAAILMVSVLASALATAIAYIRFGGISGDVGSFSIVVAECAAVIMLAI